MYSLRLLSNQQALYTMLIRHLIAPKFVAAPFAKVSLRSYTFDRWCWCLLPGDRPNRLARSFRGAALQPQCAWANATAYFFAAASNGTATAFGIRRVSWRGEQNVYIYMRRVIDIVIVSSHHMHDNVYFSRGMWWGINPANAKSSGFHGKRKTGENGVRLGRKGAVLLATVYTMCILIWKLVVFWSLGTLVYWASDYLILAVALWVDHIHCLCVCFFFLLHLFGCVLTLVWIVIAQF